MRRSTYNEEEPKKKLLGLAVAVAGMTFGVSNASANPQIGCGCTVLLRTGVPATFSDVTSVEELKIRVAESGDVLAQCQVDLGPGTAPQQTFNFANTGFNCFILGTPTTDWQEIISANTGQTTITCHINGSSATSRPKK
jgi:hypothetical protein